MEKLDLEKQISALPPVVLGGLVVVPMGLIAEMTGTSRPTSMQGGDKQASAARARAAIMEVERGLGFEPTDREFERLGYDIESRDPVTGKLRFLEVKGRISGAETITVTRNEILYSLNKPEDFILAIVEFLDEESHRVHYLRRPFQKDPDFGVTSVKLRFLRPLGESGIASMTSNWLHAYVADAVRRNICTRIRCTTCGAMDLRMGVLDELTQATGRSPRQKWDREVVIEIASALAHVTPIGSERHTLVPAVRCLLFDCWSGMPLLDNDIEAVLTDSWAGDILRDMKKHHAAREVEREPARRCKTPPTSRSDARRGSD